MREIVGTLYLKVQQGCDQCGSPWTFGKVAVSVFGARPLLSQGKGREINQIAEEHAVGPVIWIDFASGPCREVTRMLTFGVQSQ